jgi:demethylmenaquinone methyltransferase/2-methoxy-6-polyprenyl-1,4-benzoquinol methylase
MRALPPRPETPPHPVLREYYPDADERQRFVAGLFDRAAPHYDWINSVMSLGGGARYRGQALRRAGLGAGMSLLDVAVGTGLVARSAAAIVGDRGRVVGLDASHGMLRELRARTSVPAVRGLAERLPFADGTFDFVTMGYALRHVSDLALGFAEFARVLRPGGRLLVLEISRPRSRVALLALRGYLKWVVPWVTRIGTRSGDAETMMKYYWETIERCVDAGAVVRAMGESGFGDARRERCLGVFSEFVGTRS